MRQDIQQRRRVKIRTRLEYEKRYFRYHRRRIQLDSFGDVVCQKIWKHFGNDDTHIHQALWMFHTANAMFIKTLELSKYPWRSRERASRSRDIQILKGWMLKDLLLWEKTS